MSGKLKTADAGRIWAQLTKTLESAKGSLTFDLSGAESIDGGVMSLLVQSRSELAERGVKAEFVGAPERVEALINLYGGHDKPVRRKKKKPEGMVSQVGRVMYGVGAELKSVVGFLGFLVHAAWLTIRQPRTANIHDVPALVERSGADAVPIVSLLNFLLGFVMGYQAARQLQTYGANLYVADLVGISVVRELAPLMTAIIVAGRSGAGFTAELATMKVSEEIDALRTMGFGPVRYLVMPRAIAMMITVPILTLIGDVVGVLGGLVVAWTSLGISPRGYVTEIMTAVHPGDVIGGLVKSVAFSVAIVLIACQQGFATSGGAEGVGRRTTSTVVTCLFAIVAIDTFFTMLYRGLGL